MQKTGIEYLDMTWNPIAMRCTRVSPGCDNCWHLTTAARLCMNRALPKDERLALIGEGPFILRARELSAPLRKRTPSVIGVQFMGDLFHEAVPDSFRREVYHTILCSPRNVFIILTKRPGIMAARAKLAGGAFPENTWHGLTVCNQQEADEKIPVFLQAPGKKFLSIEPMLGPIDLNSMPSFDLPGDGVDKCWHYDAPWDEYIDAVILGGETGPGARPMHPDWVRSVRDQCAASGVPFFFKQWGEWAIRDSTIHGGIPNNPVIRLGINGLDTRDLANCQNAGHEIYMQKVGRKSAGRLLDGRTYNELPWRRETR
jgi:protein gp37